MTTARAKRASEVLLRAFSQDVSPAHAKEKTLMALGAGAIASATATKAAGLANGSSYMGAGAIKLAAVKAGLVGALCGVIAVESAHYIETFTSSRAATVGDAPREPPVRSKPPSQFAHASDAPSPVDPPSPGGPVEPAAALSAPEAATAPARRGSSPDRGPLPLVRPGEASIESSPRLESKWATPQPVPASSATPSSSATPAPPASTPSRIVAALAEEVRLIDAARESLAAGDPPVTLRELDRYEAEYPRGKLAEEATVLRIEALVKLGNAVGAERLARGFVLTHPRSGHLPKIRSLLPNGLRD